MNTETINIHEAKTHLSKLVEQASKGESFIIAKAGKPMVKVVPLQQSSRIGMLKGAFVVPDDVDTMMADEIEAMFAGAPGPIRPV